MNSFKTREHTDCPGQNQRVCPKTKVYKCVKETFKEEFPNKMGGGKSKKNVL